MYEDIFTQIRNEAKKRNLKENTINAYCNSVDYFLRTINKDVSAPTTDDVDAWAVGLLTLIVGAAIIYSIVIHRWGICSFIH